MNSIFNIASVLDNSRDPTTVIAWQNNNALTLREFRNSVLGLIPQLQKISGQHFVLYFENSYFFATALFASLYSGKTPILLGHLKFERLVEQTHTFDAILTDIAISTTKPVINIHKAVMNELTSLPPFNEDLSLILFTSGSTGKPTPINKSITLLEKEAHLLINHLLNNKSIDNLVATVSHQHLYGLTFKILLPLLAGIPFEINSVQYHEQLNNTPQNTLIVSSPAFLKRLDIHLLSKNFTMILSAGGPLTYSEAQRVKQCLGSLPQEIYGSSETGVIAIRQQQQDKEPWYTFSGIEVIPIGDSTAIYSPLCASSPTILADNIELLDNGFRLLGRKDRIVKIEEKRVSLIEIETRLKTLPEITDAAVVILEKSNNVVLGACLILNSEGQHKLSLWGRHTMFQYFRQVLNSFLEPVTIPKKWRVLNALPYNSQGKISYNELERIFR